MSEWKEYRLGDVCEFVQGLAINAKTRHLFVEKGGLPLLRIKDLLEQKAEFFVDKDLVPQKCIAAETDLIMSRTGQVGFVFMNRVGVVHNNCFRIIPTSKDVYLPYLYWFFNSSAQREYLTSISAGSVQPDLTHKIFKEVEISLPPLEEQKEIAAILSSLDEKIDLLNSQNTTLESMAETLFRQHFIEGAQPDWGDGVIADIIDFNLIRKLTKNTIAPFLEMANLSTSTYAPSNWYYRVFTSGTKFMNGDTILARITPCLENGKGAYIDFLEDNQIAWGSTEYITMRPKLGLHPFFAYIVSRYQDFRDFAESCMQGSSGRQRVDVENLKSYEIKTPDLETINKFNNFIAPIVEKMHENNAQIRTLTELRDILLPKLMSNEIKILQNE